MSENLLEEVTSINAIYGSETLLQIPNEESHIYSLTLPSRPEISLRVEFPLAYPDVPPSILGSQAVGADVAKGEANALVEITRDVLAEIYTPGAPCIFDLLEETGTRLQSLGSEPATGAEGDKQPQREGTAGSQLAIPSKDIELDVALSDRHLHSDDPETPIWTLSDPVLEKKSLFLARCTPVTSPTQAASFVAELLATDKKATKATHNITAYRIRSPGPNGLIQYQDCDDDGETAAGGRLLHLMDLMGVWGCLVVVSRWYGGVHLGPDRFRLINQCARDAMEKGGFVPGKRGGRQ